ncbi:hypothetical protein [Blastococcus montanus]|uniref:hypothetical protein n=1 Tax=Blastococcus montanus TaxID=3144973 RepID=UPI00320935DB
MSTDDPNPSGSTAASGDPDATPPPAQPVVEPTVGASYGIPPAGIGPPVTGDPGWAERIRGLPIAPMVALLVAAVGIATLILWRGSLDDQDAATEAAFAAWMAEQGAEPETVECDGNTCAAIVDGTAYTVLVQEDEDGRQHFGIAAYTGD